MRPFARLAPLLLGMLALGCPPPRRVRANVTDAPEAPHLRRDLAALGTRLEEPSPAERERALAALSALDRLRETPTFVPLLGRLAALGDKVPVLRVGGGAAASFGAPSAGSDVVAIELSTAELPTATPVEIDALLTVARLAKVDQVFVVEGPRAYQLFARDPLVGLVAGTTPRLAIPVDRIARAASLAQGVRRALRAASRNDYVAAAGESQRLAEQLGTAASEDEAVERARAVLTLLAGAGITLDRPEDDKPAAPLASMPGRAPASSSYAALLRLRKATPEERASIYAESRSTLAGELSPERLAVLDRRHLPERRCAPLTLPAFDSPADLFALHELAGALAPERADTTDGRLPLDAWLARYDAAAAQVEGDELRFFWVPTLLAQRGNGFGVEVTSRVGWKQASRLATAHLASLRQLVETHPGRASLLGFAALTPLPGVMADPVVRDLAVRAASEAVRLRVGAAKTASDLFDSGLAVAALSMAVPGYAQGPQLAALTEALGAKLAGALAEERGWGVAGLQAAHAVLRRLLGHEVAYDMLAANLALTLTGPGVPQPALADLAVVALRYAELAARGTLERTGDSGESRAEARKALVRAVHGLDASGPGNGEMQFEAALVDLGDAAISAVVLALSEEAGEPTCGGAKRRSKPLTEALDRATQRRRTLLASPAMTSGDGVWVKRARLLALAFSDAIDVALRESGPVAFTLPAVDVERIVSQGAAGWLDGAAADAVASLYPVVRRLVGERGGSDLLALHQEARRGIAAMRRLFSAPGTTSLFSFLDDALADRGASTNLAARVLRDRSASAALEALAEHAYERGARAQGDLLLLGTMVVSGAFGGDVQVPASAVALARRRQRPIVLPLLAKSPSVRATEDPSAYAAALNDAVATECRRPDLRAITDLDAAAFAFRRGDRRAALDRLEAALLRAETEGLAIPRQTFRYREKSGRFLFNADITTSFGVDLLPSSSTFNVGVGMASNLGAPSGTMEVVLEPSDTPKGREEAARHYAHTAVFTSVLARLAGDRRLASLAAWKAHAAWSIGVRLGDTAVQPEPGGRDWALDAGSTLAIAAQQAAEDGEPFLAGALWTLVRRVLGDAATDDDVLALTRDLPTTLVDLEGLAPVTARTAKSLATLAAPLRCTRKSGDTEAYERVACGDYPTALALRIADGLPQLPRLDAPHPDEPSTCATWRALDAFLGPADTHRYDSAAFLRAVTELTRSGRANEAAVLLTRHRHERHCDPALLTLSRGMASDPALGNYLRADAMSIGFQCAPAATQVSDVATLDVLTRTFPVPQRNLELLLFAARRAQTGDLESLGVVTRAGGFVSRWRKVSPQLGSLALLVDLAQRRLSAAGPDPALLQTEYADLCGAHRPPELTPNCNLISALRASEGSAAPAAATAALDHFVATLQRALGSPRTP